MPPRSRKAEKDDVQVTEDTAARTDENVASEDADRGRNPEISTASAVGLHPRDVQFPSLGEDGDEGVEIAERSQDVPTPTTDSTLTEVVSEANHRKVFVLPLREWEPLDDEGKDAIHFRNQRAVRQSMLSQGLRAPLEQDVRFVGEEVRKPGNGGRSAYDAASVALTYEIAPTPVAAAMTADEPEYEVVHMVVSPPSVEDRSLGAVSQAEWEAGAEDRVRDAHAVRAGRATVKK